MPDSNLFLTGRRAPLLQMSASNVSSPPWRGRVAASQLSCSEPHEGCECEQVVTCAVVQARNTLQDSNNHSALLHPPNGSCFCCCHLQECCNLHVAWGILDIPCMTAADMLECMASAVPPLFGRKSCSTIAKAARAPWKKLDRDERPSQAKPCSWRSLFYSWASSLPSAHPSGLQGR